LRRLSYRHLLAAVGIIALPVSTPAQTVPVNIPDTVGAFVLKETEVLNSGDLVVRYMDSEGQHADLYIYPPTDYFEDAASDSIVLDAHAADFVESLKYGVAQGWWETYSLVMEPRPIVAKTASGEATGRVSVFVFRKRGQVYVSLMHLFLVNEQFVKSRVSLPAEGWDQTDKSRFGLQVMEQLAPAQSSLAP